MSTTSTIVQDAIALFEDSVLRNEADEMRLIQEQNLLFTRNKPDDQERIREIDDMVFALREKNVELRYQVRSFREGRSFPVPTG